MKKLSVTVAVMISTMAGLAMADEIVILNAGFEDPVIADGDWDYEVPGWSPGYYDQNGTADPTVWHDGTDIVDAGAWNPDDEIGFPGGMAPEGQNVGYAISTHDETTDPITIWDVGLSQVLADTLQADTEYVLSVQVGNAFYNESDVTADYRLELLAGGILLKMDAGASPLAGEWELQSLTFSTGNSPAQLGEPLEIRLIAQQYVDDDGFTDYEVDFDAVQLTADSIPDLLLGDVNLDGEVNGLDVDPFVGLVTGGTYQDEGDMNGDGEVNGLDVDPFVEAVVGGGVAAVPEPSALLLTLAALGILGTWRRKR